MKRRRFAVALIVVIAGLLLPAIGQSQSPHPNYQPYQVHEFAPGETALTSSEPDNITRLNEAVGLFTATTSETGFELFRSDGTVAGTGLLLDLVPGPVGSLPDTFRVIDGEAWFWAYDPASDSRRLWRSDGTAAGTRMEQVVYDHVQTVREGPLQKFNHRLFFTGVGSQGAELWATNGTSAGTYLVRDINPGAGSSDPQSFVAFDNWLYFAAFDGIAWGVWRTDRMPASTTQVQAGVLMQEPVVSGERLYFRGIDPVTQDCRLWQTDGTTTTMVSEQCPQRMIDVDGTLVFVDSYTKFLYRSDGTTAGTVAILAPYGYPYPSSYAFADEPFSENRILVIYMYMSAFSLDIMTKESEELSIPRPEKSSGIVVDNNTIYFSFYNTPFMESDRYLAKYNQQGINIQRVPFLTDQFIVFGNSILMRPEAFYKEGLTHPWVTTTSFTYPQEVSLDQSMPGSWSDFRRPNRWAAFNSTGNVAPDESYALMTQLHSPQLDWHVYATDGISRTEFLARGDTYVFLGDRLLIADGVSDSPGSSGNTTLSFSDGTAAGTESMVVKRIDADLLLYNDEAYISTYEEYQLIRTNGFMTGTTTILTSTGFLEPIMGLEQYLIISNNDGLISFDLEAGTVETLSPRSMFLSLDPQNPGRFLFVTHETDCEAGSLWSSDGTLAGTYEVVRIGCGRAEYLDVVDGLVYFTKRKADLREFWRTDGTAAGTSMIGTILHENDDNPVYSGFSRIIPTKDGFFFYTIEHDTPTRSWHHFQWINRSGSEQHWIGSIYHKDFIYPVNVSYNENTIFISTAEIGPAPSRWEGDTIWVANNASDSLRSLSDRPSAIPLHYDGQRMYFNLWEQGNSLADKATFWVTDGTLTGTVRLTAAHADAVLGPTESGALLFFATDHRGTELWVTDGTPDGTQLVADLTPGPGSTRFLPLDVTTPWQRYFLADNGVHGLELWRSDGTPAGTERLTDIAPGSLSSFAQSQYESRRQPFLYANKLLFRANDGINGYELFALPLNSVKPVLQTAVPIQADDTTATLALTLQNQSFVVTHDPLSVTLSLPPGVTYVSDTSGLPPTVSEGSVTWQAAPLSLGHARSWKITVALPAELTGETLAVSVANHDNIPQTTTLELVTSQVLYLPTLQR